MQLRRYASARDEVLTKKLEDLDDNNWWIRKAKEVQVTKIHEAMAERAARNG